MQYPDGVPNDHTPPDGFPNDHTPIQTTPKDFDAAEVGVSV